MSDVRTRLQQRQCDLPHRGLRAKVVDAVESGLAETSGVPAAVVVRSREQVIDAMDRDPFGDRSPTEGSKHFLGFFADKPTQLRRSMPWTSCRRTPTPRPIWPGWSVITCTCGARTGSRKATFSKVNWDRKLGTAVTVRNWNTVTKLVELSAD